MKKRNWQFLVYPDSAPDAWMGYLSDLHVACAISPLHDRDIWTHDDVLMGKCDPSAEGHVKKLHHHVVLMFDGQVSYEQVKMICDDLNSPRPEPVISKGQALKYLVHDGWEDKAQYSYADVVTFGCDLSSVVDSTGAISDVINVCREMGFSSFAQLINYLIDFGTDLQLSTAYKSSYLFNTYLRSASFDFEGRCDG